MKRLLFSTYLNHEWTFQEKILYVDPYLKLFLRPICVRQRNKFVIAKSTDFHPWNWITDHGLIAPCCDIGCAFLVLLVISPRRLPILRISFYSDVIHCSSAFHVFLTCHPASDLFAPMLLLHADRWEGAFFATTVHLKYRSSNLFPCLLCIFKDWDFYSGFGAYFTATLYLLSDNVSQRQGPTVPKCVVVFCFIRYFS